MRSHLFNMINLTQNNNNKKKAVSTKTVHSVIFSWFLKSHPFCYGIYCSLNQIELFVQNSPACMCVQVNAATIDGVTPLYNCCASGSVACLELLLQNGAQAHTPHAHFPSALHEACKRGKYQNQTSSTPDRSLSVFACVCVCRQQPVCRVPAVSWSRSRL